MNILVRGAAAREKLDEVQREIARISDQIEIVAHAPMTLEETRDVLRSALREAHERSRLEYAFDHFRVVDGRRSLPGPLGYADLVYLYGEDPVLDVLMKRISEESKDAGISAAERKSRLNQLKGKLEALERAEEIETMALEADGHTVIRREDVRPEILLSVWANLQPSAAVSGT